MGNFRHETYYAGDVLLDRLKHSGVMKRVLHDGGDIILFELQTGERISVQMIESGIPLYEIRKIVEANTGDGIYSLFMLWAAMMVPDHGKTFRMTDWMEGFVALNGDRVYAYEIIDREVYLFSVFLHGEGRLRVTEWGFPVRAGYIKTGEVTTDIPGFSGTWRVAAFEAPPVSAEDALAGTKPMSALDAAYAILGCVPGDDRETVRQAYYVMARKYHPDANPGEDATVMMQKVNAAYELVTRSTS